MICKTTTIGQTKNYVVENTYPELNIPRLIQFSLLLSITSAKCVLDQFFSKQLLCVKYFSFVCPYEPEVIFILLITCIKAI